MFTKLKTKTKFLLPISILIVAFLMLTTSLITGYYSKAHSLKNLQKSVILATKISQLIHETQKERGYSSGYITNNGLRFKNELLAQRVKTDEKIIAFKSSLKNLDNDYILKYMKEPLEYLVKIQIIRKQIDTFKITSVQSMAFYSKLNDEFLDVFVELSKLSQIAIITQNIIAYSNFLYAKENAGIERALGTVILSNNRFEKGQKIHFTDLVATEKLYIKIFLKFVSKNGDTFYKKTISGKDIKNVQKIREIIFSKNENFQVKPNFWFHNITSKIDKLKSVDSYLEKEMLTNIQNELNEAYRYFFFFAFLNLLGILIFIGVIVIVLRLIYNERKLKQINDRYIISSVTDTKGKIIDVSDAFCTISGYTREELIGKPHSIVRHPDMPKSAFKDLWHTIKQGKAWQGKVKNLKKDGSCYWVYANIEPVLDKHQKIEAFAAIRLDITDSVHLLEELKMSKKKDKAMLQQGKLAQMGEMIAMIAHQWRQPLTAISSTAGDLHMKIVLENYDSTYFSEKLEKIDNFSQYLSTTIDDFRGFYKEDKEKVKILFSEITKGALSIVSTSLENKNIVLTTDFRSEKKIETYPNELRQVVLNLIKNAEDILVEKKITNPTIDIKSYDDEQNAYLEVADNGGGVSSKIQEQIFEPYFSTKIKKDGTGLGLYMSKTIIEEHCNGKLNVYNNQDGATFKISIPTIQG